MPLHNGFIPREGFQAEVVLRLIRSTALNPALLLPALLLARFTKRGEDLAVLHPTALSRLRTLFLVSLARAASAWLSDRVLNNWTRDTYTWSREIVLVTGGASGIGASIVKLFEEHGVTVVVLDVQPLSFETTSSKVHHYFCDIRSPDKVNAVADRIRAEVGHPTVIINNAGVARGKTLIDSSPGDIRFTFDVNTLAHYWTVKAFLPDIIARNHGMVVTVASFAAWLTIPNMVDYGASKAAALAFHEGLTAELATVYNAPAVRTVCVYPGHTNTPLFKGYDQGTGFLMPAQHPESIADAVVRQVLSGKSGSVIVPGTGSSLISLRGFPDWYQHTVRAGGKAYMKKWSGKQVISDVDASYEAKDSDKISQTETSESTVLVSEEQK